ncbi:hypothetical protein MU0083_003907 [[Mycobacterium] kokjensenii]|uniref:Uncharacterized protein n=1 Tax=[Mycobacterium] kokjensenii TaxID=3064287 RepID=A0ABN9NH73_9MYCO|nr:hypothetical protein [Mycolicibacter sp. MU0083]CAJ1506284.1 hypothetical protein MU0083_003907 [Mycolicibacter sp. MU0083]
MSIEDGADDVISEQGVLIERSGASSQGEYRADGDSVRVSIVAEDGGRYAYYDGGSASMTYEGENMGGDALEFSRAKASVEELRAVLNARLEAG